MPLVEIIQNLIHKLEVGAGPRFFRIAALVLAVVAAVELAVALEPGRPLAPWLWKANHHRGISGRRAATSAAVRLASSA